MAEAKKDPGAEFKDLLQADRKKKQFQNVADSVFGKRSSFPNTRRSLSGSPGASLASRVGIIKRPASTTPKPNIDGQWTHDLHHRNNPRGARPSQLGRSLSAQNIGRTARLMGSLRDAMINGEPNGQFNIVGSGRSTVGQMNIKGKAAAGPFVVIASNFAPGTTAADIEAAVLPIGGEMDDCYLISESPTVMCEILFKDKDGAENVIQTFNNQKADGRLLYVYMKPGGPSPRIQKPINTDVKPTSSAMQKPLSAPPRGPKHREDKDLMEVDDDRAPRHERYDQRSRNADSYQDGRYGFGDSYNGAYNGRDARQQSGSRGMYSDRLNRGRR